VRTVFLNRTQRQIRYTCGWATTLLPGSPYSVDGTHYVVDARRLRAHQSYYWTDLNPSTMQCAVSKTGRPALPILAFDFTTSEFVSDSLQVLSQPQCPTNCSSTTIFQNRGPTVNSFSCSWTDTYPDGTVHPDTWTGTLAPYTYSNLGGAKPDAGSMVC
jgi:hypothetical protein